MSRGNETLADKPPVMEPDALAKFTQAALAANECRLNPDGTTDWSRQPESAEPVAKPKAVDPFLARALGVHTLEDSLQFSFDLRDR